MMLEVGQTLWTWRMTCPPENIGNSPLPLEKIADHPLRFLTYEGPVQNNTGTVHITDCGVFESLSWTPESLTIHFNGQHLKGRFVLNATNAANKWTLSGR